MAGITIAVGPRQFDVRPLTLAQLRAVGVGSSRLSAASKRALELNQQGGTLEEVANAEDQWYQEQFAILRSALERDYPDIKVEELELTLPELTDVVRRIQVLSGLVPAGEAQAASSTGGTSIAA